ncbi:MAG: RimK family alpha-L-glutamate ligase [Promethearchaeota archaeon]
MKIGILSKRTRLFTGKMSQYLESEGHFVKIYNQKDLIINETLFDNDFYILKSKSLFFIYAGHFLEANNIPVIPDPNISYMQKNRVNSHFLMKKVGLLRPDIFLGTSSTIKKQLKTKDFPLILKPIIGSGSKGVKIIKSKKDINTENNSIVYLENFIAGTHYNVYFIENNICVLIKPPLSHEHVPMEKIDTPNDIKAVIIRWREYFNQNVLFGHFDIVREKKSGKLYVVDVGSFPEFTNWKIDDISPVVSISRLILQKVTEYQND